MRYILIYLSYVLAAFAEESSLFVYTYKRENRAKLILPVFFAPVYAVYIMVYAYRHSAFISRIMGFVPLMPVNRIMLLNIIVISFYLALRLIIRGISALIFKTDERIRRFSGHFYEYDEYENIWFLKEEFVNFRFNLKMIIAALCVATGSFWYFLHFNPYNTYVYPAAVLILLTEIYNYLDGYTREEYMNKISGTNPDATLYGNYHILKYILEKLFPEPMLMSHTSNELSSTDSSRSYLDDLKQSDDEIDSLVRDYFTGLKENYGFYDTDLIKAVNLLMHRQNVVINNPFYEDLSEYLVLPLMNCLLSDYKVLIVVGRDAISDDITAWAQQIISAYNRTGNLFRIGSINEKRQDDIEIGILKFSDLYNKDVISANLEFLETVDFVLMMEPSRMLAASQMGLSILAGRMNLHRVPLYCILDHYVEGLADTLSHVMQINIVNVVATPHPRTVFTVMDWKASGDFRRHEIFNKEMHYLGNGIELAAAALKNQVQHVYWYSGDKSPVKDIRTLAKQYYVPIARYANIKVSQASIDDNITFSSNPWAGKAPKQAFVIVEDEESNLFAMIREYLTRGASQIFVNVISENYLLRDYMRYNYQLFLTDHKAIAAIAPDYSKTERNAVLQLIIEMAFFTVPESRIVHELSLLGLNTEDPENLLNHLIEKYTGITDSILQVSGRYEVDQELDTVLVNYYAIQPETFSLYFSKTLKNAFFIVEDEKLDYTTIDAKLFGHITQLVMPGQLLTFDGKLYRVQSVTPAVGCVLRRASDLYLSRQYYRQIRNYKFVSENEVVDSRMTGDIEITKESVNFSVTTSGYLQMKDNDDLRTAKIIDFTDSPNIRVYDREYFNKTVLKIVLPETDDRIRFTISLLMQEMFRTLFPDSWQYIAVLCVRPHDYEGMLDKYVYSAEGSLDEEAIYIVEDSEIDLGLIDAIDNNLIRILEIMADYLNWHLIQIKMPESKDPGVVSEFKIPEELKKKQGFLKRIARRIRRIFWRDEQKEKKEKEQQAKPAEQPEQAEIEPKPAEQPEGRQPTNTLETMDADDFIHVEGEDVIESDLVPDDLDILIEAKLSRYQRECYLKFGFNEIIGKLELEKVSKYLTVRGLSNGALAQARIREPEKFDFIDSDAENHCDFCGKPLTGVSYERLNDQRVRCHECSVTAIQTKEEFADIFEQTKVMMESSFNIGFRTSIGIHLADAREVARRDGSIFKPSKGVAVRTLGFAQRKGKKYSIVMENGSPRLAAILTLVHEMTHIWQFRTWDRRKIEDYYESDELVEIVYEGMAVWASIQMLYAMGETSYADLQDAIHENRDDIYGIGYRLYKEKYGMKKDGEIPSQTPFNVYPPL